MRIVGEETRPEDLLKKAISGYLDRLPPRYALSSILRTVWGTPEFVELRRRLSEEAKELSEAYSRVAEEAELGKRYSEAAKKAEAAKKFREAWRTAK